MSSDLLYRAGNSPRTSALRAPYLLYSLLISLRSKEGEMITANY